MDQGSLTEILRFFAGKCVMTPSNQEKGSLKERDQEMVIVCTEGLEPRTTFNFLLQLSVFVWVSLQESLCCNAGLLLPLNCNNGLKGSQAQREWKLGFGVCQLAIRYMKKKCIVPSTVYTARLRTQIHTSHLILSISRYMCRTFF